MASYRELSRVARLVDGIVDIDALTDEQVDALLEAADDERELVILAQSFAAAAPGGAVAGDGQSSDPDFGGEQPQLISEILRRSFKVLRGGRA